ncbi:hypothetical protein AVEN_68946-1 [Araneus ventricosus]|uniref:Uncharacterized protein n=1 Tax=Araneus ventricosus TaxID=182803 RepID=A0A4Y2HI06_ARAVE|nr:hypothetical protein AVEN_68946-1 [Araneus ventricosus]
MKRKSSISKSIDKFSHLLPRVSATEICSGMENFFQANRVQEMCSWRKFSRENSPSSFAAKNFSGCKIFLIHIRGNGISRDAALASLVGGCSGGFSFFSIGYGESHFSACGWCSLGLFERQFLYWIPKNSQQWSESGICYACFSIEFLPKLVYHSDR